jgi:hypothetical protein
MEVSELHDPAVLPSARETLLPNEEETGLASQSVGTRWISDKFSAPSGNRTPAVQPIAIPTELSWLPVPRLSWSGVQLSA